MKISFELSASDVAHFRQRLYRAVEGAAAPDEDAVLAQAEALLIDVEKARPTGFIAERMGALARMITMLRDAEFALAAEFRAQVVQALAYFADPHDVIPDDVPGLGYLDDAIMVEIVRQELAHELEAYDEFCHARDERTPARASDPRAYASFVDDKRARLFERLRERRHNLYDHG